MSRWLAFSALLISLPTLTDELVDRHLRHRASEPVGYTREQRDSMARLVQRSVAAPAAHDCGEDWVCLLAWAEEQHPTRHRKGHRNG